MKGMVYKVKENIEEDIKDLRNYISFSSKSANFSNETEWQFYKETADKVQHILSAYEKLQKENEELLEIRISAGAHNRIIELEKENERLEKRIRKTKRNKYYYKPKRY